VGRVVHYASYGTPGGEFKPDCRAAIITALREPPKDHPDAELVDLAVLNPTGMFFNQRCPHDEGFLRDDVTRPGGTWHWPERV
jgi:hypothetical protein